MPQTLLIFDFGVDEDAARQARHRLEGWRQAFHLGDRLKFKFERQAAEPAPDSSSPDSSVEDSAGTKKGKPKGKKKASGAEKAKETAADRLRLMVRLDFSGHEKLSYQQWVDRLGAEPLFQGLEKQVLDRGQDGFDSAEETFDSLP
ncbi:MAG TPA: hypothetical protein VNJ12_14180 [Candidatus Dormibacteraeota bacterium]|nr:hypothetical protein [Candidatus Dormibacteraeota bacterium]